MGNKNTSPNQRALIAMGLHKANESIRRMGAMVQPKSTDGLTLAEIGYLKEEITNCQQLITEVSGRVEGREKQTAKEIEIEFVEGEGAK